MPNRIVREGILTSRRVNKLKPHAEVFYRRLLSVVDDYARFWADPALLRANCYPLKLDVVREADISRWLTEVESAGLILLYAVRGEKYLEIKDFRQLARAKTSKFPPPESADAAQVHGTCSADAVRLRPYSESETESDSSLAPSSAAADSKREPGEIFTTAAGKDWHAPPDLLEGFAAAFPGVSIPAECAKARVWLLANPTKRKTDRGMPKFLNLWMERAQNRGTQGPYDRPRGGLAMPPPQRDPSENARRLAEARAMGERKA